MTLKPNGTVWRGGGGRCVWKALTVKLEALAAERSGEMLITGSVLMVLIDHLSLIGWLEAWSHSGCLSKLLQRDTLPGGHKFIFIFQEEAQGQETVPPIDTNVCACAIPSPPPHILPLRVGERRKTWRFKSGGFTAYIQWHHGRQRFWNISKLRDQVAPKEKRLKIVFI